MDDHKNRLFKIPAPSLGHKAGRVLWQVVWLLLFRPSPVFMHGWRCMLLRLFGAKVGKGAHPYPSAKVWAPWNLVMGDRSCLGLDSETYNVAQVRIGDDAIVSQRAYLCTASHEVREPGFALLGGPISINRNAWVATFAYVGPGVVLAEGAIAAACAVVVRDVACDKIVGGNPARPIGEANLSKFGPNRAEPSDDMPLDMSHKIN